ncbi:hypothetical protein BDW74DRAFT_176334 [Aspergillus multicolor]|uniref:Zn(II)2Cys6 transcription factor domain-containing protein n=1 Tax=Aspergillus multicolor TaxID=41759 RepID=UPI003CCCF0BB
MLLSSAALTLQPSIPITPVDTMDASSYSSSKRPPKLRSACNECHAAKVRCSGEKTGCQRCSNLRLKCAFSISRIGKVPGKRSKANRGPATVSTSSSASISASSSSLSTPIMSPPLLTTAHSFESTRTYDGRSHVPIPVSYSYAQEYATGMPLANETTYAQSLPIYPTQSHPEDMSSLNNLCWTSDLDQLGGPGLLSPAWEIDGDESLPSASSQPQTSMSSYPDFASEGRNSSRAYASPAESIPPGQYPVYLHLLQSIDQTIRFATQCRSPGEHTSLIDSILAACQRYLSTLLHITDSPAFTHTYNEEHLLFSVALDKVGYLFGVAYGDFRHRIDIYEGMGINFVEPVGYGVRYGAFEMDVMEQMSYCRKAFVEEVKRAGVCLGRLMEVMGYMSLPGSGSSSPGRHEGLCEDLKRRLDGLLDDLKGEQGGHMVG